MLLVMSWVTLMLSVFFHQTKGEKNGLIPVRGSALFRYV